MGRESFLPLECRRKAARDRPLTVSASTWRQVRRQQRGQERGQVRRGERWEEDNETKIKEMRGKEEMKGMGG